MEDLSVAVPESFREYVEPVQVRMGYLYPDIELTYDVDEGTIHARWNGADVTPSEFKKELMHQLYREKVYQETLPIRQRLYTDG